MLIKYIRDNDISNSEAKELLASQEEYEFEICQDIIRPKNYTWTTEDFSAKVRDMSSYEILEHANNLNMALMAINDQMMDCMPVIDGVRQQAWVSLLMKEVEWRDKLAYSFSQ